jgi:hypothetical protein
MYPIDVQLLMRRSTQGARANDPVTQPRKRLFKRRGTS